MPNRLAKEPSLYLRQHADNPVDWYPWGQEALDAAREQDKPLLVSIGYSACHWCHVMAHECFEDDYIAGLMNQHFICVKVDREERPDLDQIYMEAVQMITRHGGWPLNVFCLPDGKPFFGGTYFPAEDRGQGIIPWPQLLMRVSEHYKKKKDELVENAEGITQNLAATNEPLNIGGGKVQNHALLGAAKAICKAHDDEWGGFGQAPKFPPSMTLDFLLEVRSTRACDKDPILINRIDQCVETTLRAMARGGLYDQFGGGFARYSVDNYWLIPHFEKMLYDNALLLDVYTKGWMRYRAPLYKSVVEETVNWLKREMLKPDGSFAAALDADSEGVEGKYYVWTPDEVREVLKDEALAKQVCEAYHISEEGNFEHGTSNPAFNAGDRDTRDALADARATLLAHREKNRIPPGKDTKTLVAWNAMLIRGLAEAAYAFQKPEWFKLAQGAAEALWDKARYDRTRLHAVVYDQGAYHNGTLDDYAHLAHAFLALASHAEFFAPGVAWNSIERAKNLANTVIQHFGDTSEQPGFFFTSNDHETLATRKKEWMDNASPAGNSSLVHVFSALHTLTGDANWASQLDKLRYAYPGIVERAPNAVSHALSGLCADALGLIIIKVKGVDDLSELHKELVDKRWRKTFVLRDNSPEQPDGYQVCIGTQCLEPTTSAKDAVAKL